MNEILEAPEHVSILMEKGGLPARLNTFVSY